MKKENNKTQKEKMKKQTRLNFFLSSSFLFLLTLLFAACVSVPKTNIVELENKGTVMNIPTPDWVKLYLGKGLSALQAQNQYKDKYCIVGEESGVNRQFVISWADMASAQQRIGALLRTNIASRYEAAVNAASQFGSGKLRPIQAGNKQHCERPCERQLFGSAA